MLLLICAALPVLSGAALPFLKLKSMRARMAYAFAFTCLTSLAVYALMLWGPNEDVTLFSLSDSFTCAFRLEGSGKIYLGLAAALWPPAVLYASEYMAHENREGHFLSWYLAVYGAVILFAAAKNLFTLYIFYEFITLLTVPLVMHKQDEPSMRAARIYMAYLFGGAALGFAAMMGLSSFGIGAFSGAIMDVSSLAPGQVVFVQILSMAAFLGFGVKAAVFPLTRWLPEASVAPTPVTALLHAVAVVNAGVYALLRLLYDVLPRSCLAGAWPQYAMLTVSMIMVVYSSVMAVREKQVKRRLAWSTAANLGYMVLGLSLLTDAGRDGAMMHMVFHSVTKMTLFCCVGAVLIQTGRTTVREMHGLGRRMPFTFAVFAVAGASLMGLPPLPVFLSKYALATAALDVGGAWGYLAAISLLVSSVLTVIYIFTVVYPAFFMDERRRDGEAPATEAGIRIKVSLALLCAAMVLCGAMGGGLTRLLSALLGGGIA